MIPISFKIYKIVLVFPTENSEDKKASMHICFKIYFAFMYIL